MRKEQEKNQQKAWALAQKIRENEQMMDELRIERRQRMEQLEESEWAIDRQEKQLAALYQELRQAGDPTAAYAETEVQERSQQLKRTLQEQQATFMTAYKTANKQLEETNEAINDERGKLLW